MVRGSTPANAIVEKIFNKIPIEQLQSWARKHLAENDLVLLEASGNSFQVVRTLAALGYKGIVLESCHLGKLKEAHANNDKISAVRIGKTYLCGTAKKVWVPDTLTQERRDWFHAHTKAVRRTTQLRARLRSYLSDNGVRLKKDVHLTEAQAEGKIKKARQWTPRQWLIIETLLMDLRHADTQRKRWRALISQEVLTDPEMAALVRLCGIREMVAFALVAFIGDIKRFANAKKLVAYVGLNPAFDDSGNSKWSGGIGGHGNKHLRWLLLEAAQSVFRSPKNQIARWGKKLLARKGSLNLAACAVARKLVTAVWYLMMGQWDKVEEVDAKLTAKIGKIITRVEAAGLKELSTTRKALREKTVELLKTGKTYVLKPEMKFIPRKSTTLTEEYGLRG